MTSAEDVKKQLLKVTEDAARKLHLKNYTINLDLNALKGDGFLGEFYKISINVRDSGETIYFAVKKALTNPHRREEFNVHAVYENEIFFYSEVYPTLKKFEEEHHVKELFVEIPEYLTGSTEEEKEIIVFKDITKDGFVLRDKSLLWDDEHASLIFKKYGHFHAISFCLKKVKPEEYERLCQGIPNVWKNFGANKSFIDLLNNNLQKALQCLDAKKDELILKKLEKYVTDTKAVFTDACHYKGEHFCILHGDCWSNNMMFKYKDPENLTNLETMNLLDFQLVNGRGTPVFDLSYFFYAGGSKQLFDKLEHYLDIYYKSFTESCQNLGCDAKVLFPKEQLTKDWKTYSKFGLILSVLIAKIKVTTKEDALAMIEMRNDPANGDNSEVFNKMPFNENLFNERIRDLCVHMHEIDAL